MKDIPSKGRRIIIAWPWVTRRGFKEHLTGALRLTGIDLSDGFREITAGISYIALPSCQILS
jgi:hypothetical protein